MLIKKILAATLAITCHSAQAEDFTTHDLYDAFAAQAQQEFSLDKETLERALKTARYNESALKIMSRPGESKAWWQYRSTLITPQRIKQGIAFKKKYAQTLTRAEATFGVPQSVILGVIGVETAYGTNKGNFSVLDVLASLGFYDTRRREFFQKELLTFISLNQTLEAQDIRAIKGSYAGAMGYGQFMPSSIVKYAIDFDDDTHVDLINNPVDAIGSIANYLAAHGWQKNSPIAVAALFWEKDDSHVIATDLTQPVLARDLFALGLLPIDDYVDLVTPVNGIKLMDKTGPEYWITFNNFQVITTYNRSRMYAMAVYQLGQAVFLNNS